MPTIRAVGPVAGADEPAADAVAVTAGLPSRAVACVRLVSDPIDLVFGSPHTGLVEAVAAKFENHFRVIPTPGSRPDVACFIDPRIHERLVPTTRHPQIRLTEIGPPGRAEAIVVVHDGLQRNLVAPAAGPAVVTAATRVLRAKAATALLRHGWVPIHASSVVGPGGRAVALAGPRRVGKTSMLLTMLDLGAGSLLSNDTLFVRVEGDMLVGRSLPVSVGVRTDVLPMSPALQSVVERGEHLHVDNEPPTPRPTDRVYLDAQELASLLNTRLARSAPIRSVVRVAFDCGMNGYSLDRISDPASLIDETRLDADQSWMADWLEPAAVPSTGLDILGSAEFYHLRYGADGSRWAAKALMEINQ